MKYNYCTLFDKGFLVRALALYRSIQRYSPRPFRYFFLCMDQESYEILQKMNLPDVTLISLFDFETDELRRAKKTRNFVEYCWTLSPSLPLYVLNNYKDVEMVTYLDADLFFFTSPLPLYNELGENSIYIIPHRLPERKKTKEADVGKYNVGMLIFRNNVDARRCLDWWREECNKWCYQIPEDGKLGDQKYLDLFEEKFLGVCVSKHKGACVAGWNIENYDGKIKKDGEMVVVDGDPLFFFHFSKFVLYWPKSRFLPSAPVGQYHYNVPGIKRKLIYRQYREALYCAMEEVISVAPDFRAGMIMRPNFFSQMFSVIIPFIRDMFRK